MIKQTIAGKIAYEDGKKYIEIHIADLPKRYLTFENQQYPNRVYSQRFYIFSNGNYCLLYTSPSPRD
ncbi:hypothetical protein KQJ29_32545, partial [Enterococcus sp. S181_ASV_20]|nr:hypothetical protein [Enterococcus sp. S181_ASV_20]